MYKQRTVNYWDDLKIKPGDMITFKIRRYIGDFTGFNRIAKYFEKQGIVSEVRDRGEVLEITWYNEENKKMEKISCICDDYVTRNEPVIKDIQIIK